ncbi:hypothetical protein TNCV_1234441 [Trichonephila clavipes]|nr:hypothetical protein TNCV_1234441 [Trichonephila clavipes]
MACQVTRSFANRACLGRWKATAAVRDTGELTEQMQRLWQDLPQGGAISHFSSTFSLPLYYRESVHPMVNVLSTYHLDCCTPNIKSLKLLKTNFPCDPTHFHCKYPTKVQSGWGRFPTVHTISSASK